MTDWKGWERYKPAPPRKKGPDDKTDHLMAGLGIAVGIALLIGWATLSDGFDWTGQCTEPTVQLGC